jgi:hypothetical protein
MMCFSYNSDTDCDMVVPIPDSYILVKLLLNCIYSYSLGSSTRKYSAGPLGKIHNDHTHKSKNAFRLLKGIQCKILNLL